MLNNYDKHPRTGGALDLGGYKHRGVTSTGVGAGGCNHPAALCQWFLTVYLGTTSCHKGLGLGLGHPKFGLEETPLPHPLPPRFNSTRRSEFVRGLIVPGSRVDPDPCNTPAPGRVPAPGHTRSPGGQDPGHFVGTARRAATSEGPLWRASLASPPCAAMDMSGPSIP